jgi:putative flippase GtrA
VKKLDPRFSVELYNYLKVTFLDKQVIRFLIVGGAAFVVNGGFLYIIHGLLHVNLLASQIISSELAIGTSFSLHHHWTYKGYQDKPLYIRFLRFNATAFGGVAISTLTLILTVNILKINYLIGFVLGAFLALFWNYFANKYFIWAQLPTDNV